MKRFTVLLFLLLPLASPALAVDGGNNQPPALNAAQYPSMPPPTAKIDITASTQPTEEGKAPPPPDVSVSIPMTSQLYGLPVPTPKLDGDEWTPKNVWELVLSVLGTLLVIWIAAPLLKDLIKKRLNLGKQTPPTP